MPDKDAEPFSNPLPPPDHRSNSIEDDSDLHPLTNEDFRKMLMTPRGSSSSQSTATLPRKASTSIEQAEEEDDPAARRKKKKSYYAKLKKTEEERQKELESKYRDRAKERREGVNADYAETEIISTSADYRAVAPDAKSGENYAERRKQVIQESKYLGGDMEHTHLVKGLDYALLEKVRAEITSKEREDEDKMEKAVTSQKPDEEDPEEKILFKTKLGRNIYRTLFKSRMPERNELFMPRRMAYVVDLEDEFADSDVPTTLIRSKADCPAMETTTTLTTNDIVINKLTQILSYLRQGRREMKKLKKKEKGKLKEDDKPKEKLPGADDAIYADLMDYNPVTVKGKEKRDKREDREYREHRGDRDRDRDRRDYDKDRYRERDRDRDREAYRSGRGDREREHRRERELDRQGEKRRSYFEKPAEEEDEREKAMPTAKDLVKSINDRFKTYADLEEEKQKMAAKAEDDRIKKLKAKTEIDSYAECYPGMMESADAIGDSDDEVDYTKMDQGNKKGPIGRWDFDTQEEYSNYMSNKEALPKAAFQYGVKMADGRRTRRTGPKDEKAKLDRELQQIQRIIDKRKTTDGDSGSSKRIKF